MNDLKNTTLAELMRLRRWPAVKVILAVWLLLVLLFGYVFDYVSYTTGTSSFSNDDIVTDALLAGLMPNVAPEVLLGGMPMFGGALFLTLGAITAASGYGWGTWKTTYLQRPGRGLVSLGSVIALAVVTLVTVVGSVLFCLACSLTVAIVEGQAVTWPTWTLVAQSVGTGTLVLTVWAMVGYLLGTLTRSPALAVGFGLVWALVLEAMLRGVGCCPVWRR